MTQLTRRSLLAGTAAAALGTIPAAAPARATAPLAGKQAPGFYRYAVGTYEITVVTDGAARAPLADDFVTNIKKDEVQAALAAAHMSSEIFFNPPGLEHADLATLRTKVTDEWADLAKSAGMTHLLLCVKHVDGFCLWDSAASPLFCITCPARQAARRA